jgi:hypothetical protein
VKNSQHALTILAGGREISPHRTKHLCALVGAKTTGYFRLNFHHADISFRLIVGLSSQLHLNGTLKPKLFRLRIAFTPYMEGILRL